MKNPILPSIAICLLAASTTWAADGRRVGVAAVDITPAFPIRLRGYSSRKTESEGVTHRLSAEAMAIGSDDEGPAVLITFDNCIVPDALVRRIAARLEKRAGLPRERLTVGVTHTHNGPILSGMSATLYVHPLPKDQAERIDRYTRELEDRLVAVALAALEKREPATLSWATGTVKFAHNRRTKGGPADHDLPFMVARSVSGEILGVWLSYACHCTTLSHNRISGDWAGYAKSFLRQQFPGAVALVSGGCGGDQNPFRTRTAGAEKQDELAAMHGREILSEVTRQIDAGALKPIAGGLSIRFDRIELPLDKLPTRAEWEERARNGGKAGTAAYHARVHLARLDRGEKLPTAVPYPVQTWSFGDDLAIVFLGGEAVVDYSIRLKRELDRKRLWVNAYSNDVACYIPSERVLAEGGYEGGGAMIFHDWPTRFAAGIEERIVAAVKRQVPEDFARAPSSPDVFPVLDEEVARYTAYRAGTKIEIDGRLDERCWQVAPRSPSFVDLVSGETAVHETRAAVLWDDEKLYVGFWIEEPFLRAKYTKRDSPIYYDNDVECFIAGQDGYYELEINAFGTVYEAFFVWEDAYESGGFAAAPEFQRSKPRVVPFNGVGFKTHPRGKRVGFLAWDFPGLESAVHVDGTLNEDADRDRGWTVEVAFPWGGMKWLARGDGRSLPPRDGDTWRMDFSRFNQFKQAKPANDSGGWAWSRHGVWDSHIPECFPYIRFSSTPLSELSSVRGRIRVPGVTPRLVLKKGAGEGPAWDPTLGLLFSGGGDISRLGRDGRVTTYRRGAGSNGLLFDHQGRLLACEPRQRRVTRTELDGSLTVLAATYRGKRFNQPNDLAVDSSGRIYFSDPQYGDRNAMEMLDERGRKVEGVYRVDPDRSVTRVVTHEVDRPNGLVITPNDKYLYVTDNNNNTRGGARKLWRFELGPDGEVDVASRELVFDWGTSRGPDGMVLDQRGRLYVAGGLNEPRPPVETTERRGGVYVLSPTRGELLDFIPIPRDEVTNCTFGGADLKTLYITAGGTLWSLRTTTPGQLVWPSR